MAMAPGQTYRPSRFTPSWKSRQRPAPPSGVQGGLGGSSDLSRYTQYLPQANPPDSPMRTPLPEGPYEETSWGGPQFGWMTGAKQGGLRPDEEWAAGGRSTGGAMRGPTIAGYSPGGGVPSPGEPREPGYQDPLIDVSRERLDRGNQEIDFQRRLDELTQALYERTGFAQSGGGAGGGIVPPDAPSPVAFPSGGGASAAAQAAAFARAKDRIGAGSQGALTSLQHQFAGRGLSGTPMEGAGIQGVIEGAQGQLGEASRDIALEESRRAQEIEDRNIEAALAQRAQDIGVRGQDIGAQESAAQLGLQRQNQLQALFQAMRQRQYLY